MKKLIASLLILVMCLGVLAACGQGDKPIETGTEAPSAAGDTGTKAPSDHPAPPEDTGLEDAVRYLHNLYKDQKEVTPSDFTVVGRISISDVIYEVEWSVDVTEGVTIEAGEDHSYVVHVDGKAPADIPYVLTATVRNSEGRTLSKSYPHKVPAYHVNTWAEYAAAEKDATLVVQGVISGIIAKSRDASNNCLFLQDKTDGGYYVFGLQQDPIADLHLEAGMTVEVAGVKDIYNGTDEIKDASVTIVSDEKTPAVPADYTAIYTAAQDLKAADLVAKQGMLVTLKGVEITGQNEANGYLHFKLGDKESYVRLSGSTSTLNGEEKKTFKNAHGEHTGWTANVTGLISVFNGEFYLVPADANAIEYVSLPTLSDAGMIEKEKGNIRLPDRIGSDGVIALPLTGKGYTQVSISWTSDLDCAVVGEDGRLTVTLPENDAELTLTATLTSGAETATVTFKITVESAPTDLYLPALVEEPVAGRPYKLFLYQANLDQNLYFAGRMDGFYLASTDRLEKAADVTPEEADGGFRLSFMDGETKTYIDVYDRGEGKAGVRLTTDPGAVFTYDGELDTFLVHIGEKDFYLGTYKTFATFSASETKYITGENAAKVGVSQFVAHLATPMFAELAPEPVAAPEAGASFKLFLHQANLDQNLYFAGRMDGFYLASTDRPDKAADVTPEEADGGFRLSFMDGETKTYIDVYDRGEGKAGIRLTTDPGAVFTYDGELGTFLVHIGEKDFYLGAYKEFATFSASETKYITGENAAKVGVSQFVARPATLKAVGLRPKAAEPAPDAPYKLSLFQANISRNLLFAGRMDGFYLATTESLSKATDVFTETADGGFRIYFLDGETKTYIDLYDRGEGKAGVRLTTDPGSVYTYDEGLQSPIAHIGEKDFYLGAYKTYATISASDTQYVTGDNAAKVGVSQFVARLVTMSSADVPEEMVIDMASLEGNAGYQDSFEAAGYTTPIVLYDYGVTIALGQMDLSKYSQCVITYGCDGSDVTQTAFENSSSLAIGLKSEATSYGEESADNFNGDLAHTDMTFSTSGWASGAREAVVDLSGVTYSGDVFVAVHNPLHTQIAVSAVRFIG